MNAQFKPAQAWISEEGYLAEELLREIRHEYVDGYVYAMPDVSKNHQRIIGNLYWKFGSHLKGARCEPFASNLKLKVGSKFFYPDVMVVCEDTSPHEYYAQTPVLVVEVLSKNTRRTDETLKRVTYQSIPTLREYVLIEQDFVDVEVCRRSEGWVSNHYFLGDSVPLESIGLVLPVEEIYARVENEDMRLFEEKRAKPVSPPPSLVPSTAAEAAG